MHRRWTPYERRKLDRLLSEGSSYRGAGFILGRTPNAIKQVLQRERREARPERCHCGRAVLSQNLCASHYEMQRRKMRG